MRKIIDFLFPPPTPDQELVREIKQHVEAVARLGKEARKRDILIWLEDTGIRYRYVMPHHLVFHEAKKTKTEKIG